MIKVKEHLREFIPGFKPEVCEISNLSQLKNINFIKKFKTKGYPNSENLKGIYRSKLKFKDYVLLIAVYKTYHRVIAYVYCDPNDATTDLKIEEYSPI